MMHTLPGPHLILCIPSPAWRLRFMSLDAHQQMCHHLASAFKEICMCLLAVYSRSLCLFVSSVHFPPGELSLLLLHSVIIIHLLCMLQMS